MADRQRVIQGHRRSLIVIVVLAALASIGVLFWPSLKIQDGIRLAATCHGAPASKHNFDITDCLSMITGLVAMAAEPFETLATSASKTEAIALGAGPVEVLLTPPSSNAGAALAARVAVIKPSQKLYLTIKGLRTNEQPEVLYQIYFALPSGVMPSPDGLHYIGSLNFFNAGNGDRNAANGGSSRVYSYDVTDLVKSLQARKLLGETSTVTIIPKGKPAAAAKAFIGEIALVQQ